MTNVLYVSIKRVLTILNAKTYTFTHLKPFAHKTWSCIDNVFRLTKTVPCCVFHVLYYLSNEPSITYEIWCRQTSIFSYFVLRKFYKAFISTVFPAKAINFLIWCISTFPFTLMWMSCFVCICNSLYFYMTRKIGIYFDDLLSVLTL